MTEALRTAPNRYTVDVWRDEVGWSVAIVDPNGREASLRACGSEDEARTYASTVRQHIGWLSQERFREIYRLATDERGTEGSGSEREHASGNPPAGEGV